MNLLAFHNHLQAHGVDFLHLNGDFTHAIYHKKGTDKYLSIYKGAKNIKTEIVQTACVYFNIQYPNKA